MNHGSKYTWIPETSLDDADMVLEADVQQNLWDQDDQIFSGFTYAPTTTSTTSAPAPPPPPQQKQEMNMKKLRKVRQVDTNVISVHFGTLIESAQLATGDPVLCKGCKAAFSQVSTITKQSQEKQIDNSNTKPDKMEISTSEADVWICEFCGASNEVQFEPEEIPKTESVDYVIGTPAELVSTKDENMVIFCIDISGSMGVSYPVQGKFKLKGEDKVQKLSNLNTERNAHGQLAEQFLPNERRDITYVTRLQCVQAAISAQIEKMKKEHPNRRVGIVTFNNEVNVIGDGTEAVEVIAGDKLNSFDTLLEIGTKHELKKSIKDTFDSVSKRLFSLEEGGSTALGPALVTSIGISQKYPGSTIVLCTDGLSNIGLGSLDDLWTDEEKEKASAFYEQVGHLAKAKGLIISVVSIKGSDCSIENLGTLSELTAGIVERVDPLVLAKNFQTILDTPVIAIQVSMNIFVHKDLFIRKEDKSDNENNSETREIGNVTKDSAVTFEYGVRPTVKRDQLSKMKVLPFQLQIKYTRLDGMKCMRVISKSQELTFDRKQAEETANVDVLGVNAIQQTANIAKKGSYSKARLYNLQHKQMLSRAAKTDEQKVKATKWGAVQKEFEDNFAEVAQTEQKEGLNLSDDEEDFVQSKEMEAKKKEKEKMRKEKRKDDKAQLLYNMKSISKPKPDFDDDEE